MLNVPAERHPTLYFPNGDVVLSASIDSAGPPRTQLFGVHKFLLIHHSTTFANMFTDAAAGPGETYDGVPIIQMEGDDADDLATLLNYLYNPTEMTFERFDPDTPLVVSGVIRLADKYCIEKLREHLIKVVVSDWPTTLQEWDVFQVEVEAAKQRVGILNSGKFVSDWDHVCNHVPEPASAIAFAQEFGCREILSAAFYQLMLTSPSCRWEDHYWRRIGLVARWSLLDKDALRRYMIGVDAFLRYRPAPHKLLSQECRPMTAEGELDFASMERSPCYTFSKLLLDRVWARNDGMRIDPLDLLQKCVEYGLSPAKYSIPGSLCDRCDMAIFPRISSLRTQIWGRVPVYFEIHTNKIQ
ncbi:hypothetical protein V8D89_000362 [Ganoderma adspersum]